MAKSAKGCPSYGRFNTTTDWGFGGGIWSDNALMKRLNVALFVILLLMHVFDTWSTGVILMRGGKEWNPIVIWFMNAFGIYTGLLLIKAYVVLLSGLLVKTYINSPVVGCSLALVIVIMADTLLINNLPLILFIYGGT